MANLVRERMHGDITYFNVNRHINPTDVCVASCRLCAFGKQVRDPKAYTMSLEEVWHRAGEGWSEAVTEFHIVGGLHPELTLDWYCEMLRGLEAALSPGAPEGVHDGGDRRTSRGARRSRFARCCRSCATPAWIRCPAAARRSSRARAAHHLRSQDRRRRVDGRARTAHQLGLKSNCTMLYGHIENEEDRVDHLVKLRELQDETHGFVTFIPLAFHPDNTPCSTSRRPPASWTSRTSRWRG